jgi:hypothetical protein
LPFARSSMALTMHGTSWPCLKKADILGKASSYKRRW